MGRRVVAVVLFGFLLVACGGARYTIRQAVVDMPAFEPPAQYYDTTWDKCVAEYLFQRLPPEQVKTIIQGADLGYLPPIETQAQFYCDLSPSQHLGLSGVAPSSASLDHPSKRSARHRLTAP